MTNTGHITCQHGAYRLTCQDYDALWDRAEGKCEICRTPAEETTRGSLSIDHDHIYGFFAVRGLLCDACNTLMSAVDSGAKSDMRANEYRRNPWFLELLLRRHAENVAAARVERHLLKSAPD